MDDRELQNECLLTAVSLLDGELEDRATTGNLELRENPNGTWDAHRHDGELLVFVDTISPRGFPSARFLASYLCKLSEMDASRVDLPNEPAFETPEL